MTFASKSLKRLAALYAVVEQARSEEMRHTSGLLLEVEEAIVGQEALICRANVSKRVALDLGDRLGWLAAETHSSTANHSVLELAVIRTDRKTLNAAVTARYIASRLQSEQMRSLLDTARTKAELVEERRSQTLVEDRFLSRKLWQALKESRQTYEKSGF